MDSSRNNGYQQYQQADVTSASPEALVALLYTELLRCLVEARAAQMRQDKAAKNKNTSKVIHILTELMGAVDMEKGDTVAWNLVVLYEYLAKRLLHASGSQTTEAFDEAIRLLTPIKEAWQTIATAPSASNAPHLPVLEAARA